MSCFRTGSPGKEHGTNKPPPTGRVQERSKGDTTSLTTFQNLPCSHQSWLTKQCTTRKDSESCRPKISCTTWELWVKFNLVHNEDCSPGGSISNNSERLLQSGSGGSLRFWWRGSSIPWSTQFTKGFLLVTRVWCHHERIQSMGSQRVGHHWATSLSLFRYEEMQGLTAYNLFLKTSNYLKTCPTRFPEHRLPHCTLNSLGDCWRPTATEADGRALHCSVLGMLLVSVNL